jgi:putative DNA primase/helicase
MRQDFFEFLPFFKLTIVGNHEPVLRNVDEAMRRRFNVIPFVRKPEKVDRDLAESLREEWPGILRWMIEGCLHWQEHGLVRPEVVAERTNAYFDDQDSLAHWLQEKCEVEVGNSYKRASAGELFASWSAFALASNDEPGSKKSLSAALQKRGFEPYRTANERGFMGIRLKPTMGRFGDD